MNKAHIIIAFVVAACGSNPETEAAGALESLGEYEVGNYNTCGTHWDGIYTVSANRVAQYGGGTDQLFFEPADPSSAAERGRGSLAPGPMGLSQNVSLQIRFVVGSDPILYDCHGGLTGSSMLLECDSGESRCHLALSAVQP